MSKYEPLKLFLQGIQPAIGEKSLSFSDIERILGFKLPDSAYKHRAWWSNPTSSTDHPYAQSWLEAGWRVDAVDQLYKRVNFRRTRSHITEMGIPLVADTSLSPNMPNTLNIESDSTTQTTDIEHNATLILRAMSEQPREKVDFPNLSGDELNKLTGLNPDQINDAVTILVQSGCAKTLQTLGTAPYDFMALGITPLGRITLEKANKKSAKKRPTTATSYFVDLTRIEELEALKSKDFDLARLIQMCKELNICYSQQCYYATAMLTRSILDHIPPILNLKSFGEIANNYSGTKSFKASMGHLENSSRSIADASLHTNIRNRETLLNATQVNFSNDLDVLLAEIIRLLK